MGRAGELDLDPATKAAEISPGDVLVPLHADNWALGLASGYIGGGLKADQAADAQSYLGVDLWGFSPAVPEWALAEGEDGPRVVLRLSPEDFSEGQGETGRVLRGPVRVSKVKEACFETAAALDNFVASYSLLPDVAADLVPAAVGGYPREPGQRPTHLPATAPQAATEARRELDFYAGWAAALLELLEVGELEPEVVRQLERGATSIGQLAENSLVAMEPAAAPLDLAIWQAAVLAIKKRYGARGFDREEFLSEIQGDIVHLGADATTWITGCRQVFSGDRDVPSLDDGAHVGRRAALGLMLAREAGAVAELENSFGAGPRVRALVAQATYAFGGFARLDAVHKRPSARLDAVLSVAEAFVHGRPISVATRTISTNADMSRSEALVVDGAVAFTRTTDAPAHLLMLKARAQEAGFKVRIDDALGLLCISAGRAGGPVIVVEQNDCSTSDQPVVNLVVEVARLGARPSTATLKSYLELAWKHSVSVGLRPVGGVEIVCAFASISLPTLDRDEFRFHVDRLFEVAGSRAGKKKPARAPKRLAGA